MLALHYYTARKLLSPQDFLTAIAASIARACKQTIQSRGIKSHMLHSGISNTKAGQGGLVRVALYWSPTVQLAYHVTGSYKGAVMIPPRARPQIARSNQQTGKSSWHDKSYYPQYNNEPKAICILLPYGELGRDRANQRQFIMTL